MCCSHASMSLLRFASNQLDMHQLHHQVFQYPWELCIHVFFIACHCWTSSYNAYVLLYVVGAKGAVDQKNARRYSMGTIPNGRPTVNYSYLSNNAPVRAGNAFGLAWHTQFSLWRICAFASGIHIFLPCQCCSWRAKEIGVGTSGEYKLLAVHIDGCSIFSELDV